MTTLPFGVTLDPIDGGPNYYADNGLTYAAAAGWDNPSFFPVGPWQDNLATQSDANRWIDLGWNTSFGAGGNTNPAVLRANGIWMIQRAGGTTWTPIAGTGAETVGINAQDEPTTYSAFSTAISTTANALQDGRFWWLNNTTSILSYGGISGTPGSGSPAAMLYTPIATPDGTTRHIDVSSVDEYWFAGIRAPAIASSVEWSAGVIWNGSVAVTADQVQRGSNYGSMIDAERKITGGTTPIYAYIEDGGPYTQDTTAASYITPPELNWATWSSLIHGARGVIYFNDTFAYQGPGYSFWNMESAYYQAVQPGQTVSMYAQVKATDALIKQLAPVLNSPTAIGYATVNNPGYENGATQSLFSGIEVTAKDDNGQFYLLTDTRDSETQTNISATFTLADKNATSVTVVGENRTIAVTNGVFTDTYATGATVHIYEVNDGATTAATPSVTSVAPSPASGTEDPGSTITFAVNMTEAVTVAGGTPTFSLNDGGKATYKGGSGTNALTFSYTVGSTDSDVSSLAITAVNLPTGVTITDGAGNAADMTGALATFTGLSVDPPAAPTITGAVSGQMTRSEAPVGPFAKVTVADANVNATDTLTITLSGAGGLLTDGTGFSGLATTATPGVYTLSGTAAAITSELDALSFKPKVGAPNSSSTTTFTLSDLSSAYATPAADSSTSVIDGDPAVAPTIAGAISGQTTTSEVPVSPFANVTVADANANATDTLTITLGGAGGTLTDGTGFSGLATTATPGVYTLSGTAAAITNELDALSFKPTAGLPNTISTTTFALSNQSTAYAVSAVDSSTSVIDSDPAVTSPAVAPTITGAKAGQTTTSEAPVKPFSAVTIADANVNATDTLTITIGGAGGVLTGAGLSGGTGGVYTLSGMAAAITNELDALSFKPKAGIPNTTSTTTFTLSDTSSAGPTPKVDNTTSVIDSDPAVTSPAVAPTITGAKAGQTTTSEAPVKPFSAVTIADANVNATDTLTIKLGGAGGTLADGRGFSGLATTATPGVYTLSGTAAAITGELDALTFKPKAGLPNTTSTTTFTLSDTSSAGATPRVDNTTSVIDSDPAVTSPAVAPTITGTKAGRATTSEAPVKPFSTVTIADANAKATDTLTIKLVGAGGALADGKGFSGLATTATPGVYTLSGTAAAITGELDALTFKPKAGLPNTTSTTTFTLSDQSSAGATPRLDNTTSVIDSDPAVTSPAIAPTITGTKAGRTTTSEAPVKPFSTVTIADANAKATDTLTIKLVGAGGALTGTGLSGGTGGVYTLSGTAAAITGELDTLSFKPKAGIPNTTSTTTFTLSDTSSAHATPAVDSATSAIDRDPAVAPTMAGAVSSQTAMSKAGVQPFAKVTIADANAKATETLTITLGGAGGVLSGVGLSGGKVGVYTLSGTAARITSELDALAFTPTARAPNTTSTTTFTLSDQSSAYATLTVERLFVSDLTPGMVQAAHLAAVIARSSSGASGTTIPYTTQESLTLLGITQSPLEAHYKYGIVM